MTADPTFEMVPIGRVHPSTINIRKLIKPEAYASLLASVKAKGVLTPLLVRPQGGDFEIAAGHTRHKAATDAGLDKVPVLVREMNDEDFLDLVIIDNLQRNDVHPLDEARGYAAMQKAGKTPEQIAARVSKPVAYVYRRLKLTKLIPDAQRHLERGGITVSHGELLARLTPAQQASALEECIHWNGRLLSDNPREERAEPAPLSRLEHWIDKHLKTELAGADTPHYFPEFAEEIDAEGDTLLQLSGSHTPDADLGTQKHGMVGRASWVEIKTKKDECPHVRKGVVVHGGPMRILRVCAQKGCPKHRPPSKLRTAAKAGKSASPAVDAKRLAKEAAERRTRELEEARKSEVDLRCLHTAVANSTSAQLDVAFRAMLDDLLGGDVDVEAFNETFKTKWKWRAGTAPLKSLSDLKLRQALVFCTISRLQCYGDGKELDALLHSLGVDRKAVDRDVAAEQLEQERLAGHDDPAPRAPKKAKKR